MADKQLLEKKNKLMAVINNIQARNAAMLPADEYEFVPGKFDGGEEEAAVFDSVSETLVIKTEVLGTQYDNRSDRIEDVRTGDDLDVKVVFEPDNPFNASNFMVINKKGESLGCVSAEIADVCIPLLAQQYLSVKTVKVSFVEPISQRSARANKAILYVEITAQFNNVSLGVNEGCALCVIKGNQDENWAQHIEVITSMVPIHEAKLICELYNRYTGVYDEIDAVKAKMSENANDSEEAGKKEYITGEFSMDNLKEEINDGYARIDADRIAGADYSVGVKADSADFVDYVAKMCKNEPTRYGELVKFASSVSLKAEDRGILSLFEAQKLYKKDYFWLDEAHVTREEWGKEKCNEWNEVLEVYPVGAFPCNLEDEEIISMFGFNRFAAFVNIGKVEE